mmetsp:Transcript_2869/g.6861  ORF Transcript_2869/g.6861 Transcript_2869/m.6861 type:complete len:323 (+) Transcript_2869:54-1022(+)
MEDVTLQRGNCSICRQRRVLGRWLEQKEASEQAFRCCACLDQFDDGDVPSDADASHQEAVEDGLATNWWACSEPPLRLEEVPEGFLLTADWTFDAFDAVGNDRPLTTVCDPDHCYFSGLGAERVWGAGLALARHLARHPSQSGQKVVELGAGCGLPGMVLARQGSRVTLTDVPWLLQLIEYNISANFSVDDPCRPRVAPLRWGNQEDMADLQQVAGRPDLVIGADLVYRHQDFNALLQTIESLRPGKALLAVQRRDRVLEEFMRYLTQLRWGVYCCMIAYNVVLLEVFPPAASAQKTPSTCTVQAVHLPRGIDRSCQAAAAA